MTTMRLKRHIEAPVETVFARGTDFANAANVMASIIKIEMLTDGPVGVGTRFRETRTMFGREASETMEVIEFDPPHRCVLGAESHGSRYRTALHYTPVDDGTEVEMVFHATPLTLFAKVMSVVMKPFVKKVFFKECGKDLDDLKVAIEGG